MGRTCSARNRNDRANLRGYEHRLEAPINSRSSPMLTPRRPGLRKTIPKASPLSTK